MTLRGKLAIVGAIIASAYLVSVVTYYASTPTKRIAQRAFTVGDWNKCKEGPTLWDRHMANISYAYFLLPGTVDSYHASGRSLVMTALQAAKCDPGDKWIAFDSDRVKRGIRLGIRAGASVNEIGFLGMSPVHVAVFVNRPELLKLLVESGGDISMKTWDGPGLSGWPSADARELAEHLQRDLQAPNHEIVQYLERLESNKPQQQERR